MGEGVLGGGVGEVVNDDDADLEGEEGVNEVPADEPAPAGDADPSPGQERPQAVDEFCGELHDGDGTGPGREVGAGGRWGNGGLGNRDWAPGEGAWARVGERVPCSLDLLIS